MSSLHELFFRFPKAFPLPFVLDGATGTNLIAAGMPAGVCTEDYVDTHPDVMRSLQASYREAGSDAVLSPTFGANRLSLEKYGRDDVAELNHRLVAIAKSSGVLVGGDLSPTGCFLEPYGDKTFDEIADTYAEQAKALDEAGVDFFEVETMVSLNEMRAAVYGVKSVSDKPIFCTLTVEEGGFTMNGDSLKAAFVTAADLGVSAFGANCSFGPSEMLAYLKELVPLSLSYGIPLIAKPNAGLPIEENGVRRYPMGGEEFGAFASEFLANGIFVLGGCCGTDATHIGAVRKAVEAFAMPILPEQEESGFLLSTNRVVADRREAEGHPFVLYGPDTDLSSFDEGIVCLEVPDSEVETFLADLYLLMIPAVVKCSKESGEKIRRLYNGKIGLEIV